jgi:hypothetical protein
LLQQACIEISQDRRRTPYHSRPLRASSCGERLATLDHFANIDMTIALALRAEPRQQRTALSPSMRAAATEALNPHHYTTQYSYQPSKRLRCGSRLRIYCHTITDHSPAPTEQNESTSAPSKFATSLNASEFAFPPVPSTSMPLIHRRTCRLQVHLFPHCRWCQSAQGKARRYCIVYAGKNTLTVDQPLSRSSSVNSWSAIGRKESLVDRYFGVWRQKSRHM